MDSFQNLIFYTIYVSFWIGCALGLANSPQPLKEEKDVFSKIFILIMAFLISSWWPLVLPAVAAYKLTKWEK